MKICPVQGQLSHEDRKTDRQDEANTCFSQFCEHALKVTQHMKHVML